MEKLLRDLRYALVVAARRPIFSLVVIVTLSLGIGVTTVSFSLINSILLHPLRYDPNDRLAMLWHRGKRTGQDFPFSEAVFVKVRRQVEEEPTRALDDVAAYQFASFNFTEGDTPERLQGATISSTFFKVIGVDLRLGRSFTLSDEKPGADPVVILSDGFWKQNFHSDPSVVGKAIRLNGRSFTVVGVAPPNFELPTGPGLLSAFEFSPRTDVLIPLTPDPNSLRGYLNTIARLRPGASVTEAEQQMALVDNVLQQDYPEQLSNVREVVIPLQDQIVRGIRPALLILFGGAGLVLLLACTNVANLLFARSSDRAKEVAVRLALGAGRPNIIRLLLVESMTQALAAGVLGTALSLLGVKLLKTMAPGNIPRLEDVSVDAGAVLFAIGVSVLTAALFGIAPTLRASKTDLISALRQGNRSGGGGHRWTRDVLVIAEIAMSLLLLVCAGLLAESFKRLGEVRPGFEAPGLVTMQLSLPETKYIDQRQISAFLERVLDRVNSLPGVTGAAATDVLPLGGMDRWNLFETEDNPAQRLGDAARGSNPNISPEYFSVMNIPLIEGRYLRQGDNADAPLAAVLSKSMARTLWPDQDPIGRRLRFPQPGNKWLTVVGVVDDVKQMGLDASSLGTVYFSYPQPVSGVVRTRSINLLARTSGQTEAVLGSIKDAVRSLDPDQPVSNFKTMEGIIGESVSGRYFNTLLFGILAAVAILLASTGVYSVVSYGVSKRTQEIGIRMALGAKNSQVLGMIIGQAMRLALFGLLLGAAGTIISGRLISTLLFGVSPYDPLILALTSIAVAAVVFVSSYFPALRAARLNPVTALVTE